MSIKIARGDKFRYKIDELAGGYFHFVKVPIEYDINGQDKELDLTELRMSYKYQKWESAVRSNSPPWCNKCKRGYFNQREPIELCSHHIKSFANYPELRYELSNGIILCQDCHKKYHKTHKD
jgi:hypothetical protein